MTKENASSFIDLLDLEIINPNRDPSNSASAIIEVGEQHGQHNDVLHGGVLYSLADTLGGY
ncbi:MAG: PaaI family thioesterase, partial [Candidatus Hodarchaeales archaeon]